MSISRSTGQVTITHEDIDRAGDRERVLKARNRPGFSSRLRLLWLLVGPGILVMLGENDGPSMLGYAATGARFGAAGASSTVSPGRATAAACAVA